MKSLERRFRSIEKGNPYWSSYTYFAEAVENQKFSRAILVKHFNLLVEKDDYAKEDKWRIVDYLTLLTKGEEKLERLVKTA